MSLVTVHQALHGYNDGHRLLSSSLPLEGIEARLMLVMSDLSGPGVKPPSSGYLTGYPLEKFGKYVLARTWAATEMPRPGCVWTHSLLIDNADLAQISSAVALLRAFRRPDGPSHRSKYALSAQIASTGLPLPIGSGFRAQQILNALYVFPEKTVVSEAADPVEDEHLVAAIWIQQWPRLRRMFGFCTLAGADRSKKGLTLDLQLIPPGDRHPESRFPGAVTAERVPPNHGLDVLVRDLRQPEGSQLREFLRRTGGDVDGGRRAMRPLCQLYESMFEGQHLDLTAAVSAFSELDNGGRQQARSARSLVARQAVQRADSVDDDVFDFLIETLEHTGDEHERLELGDRLGAALWRRSPQRFRDALDGDSALSRIASHSLGELADVDVIDGLRRCPALVADIAKRRPDLLLLADMWRMSGVGDDLVEQVAVSDAGRLAFALIAAGRSGPAHIVVHNADPLDILAALNSPNVDNDTATVWLSALANDPNKVAAMLASGHVSRLSMLVQIARRVAPDGVPNEYGEDPWLIALRGASGRIDRLDEDFLASYLLARALGGRSRSEAELLRFAYTRVYKALHDHRLPPDVESLAKWRLSWGTWLDWDSCSRLRETVVRRFIDRHLDPETFGRLTDDGPLAISLIDEAARSGRGRKYLGEVRKSLKDAAEKGIRVRADYIAKKIK
jgi:hypothetical protein